MDEGIILSDKLKSKLDEDTRTLLCDNSYLLNIGNENIKISIIDKDPEPIAIYEDAFVIHVSPHSDDLIFASNTLKAFSKISNNIFTMLLGVDALMEPESIAVQRLTQELKKTQITPTELTSEQIFSIVGQKRYLEHLSLCTLIKSNDISTIPAYAFPMIHYPLVGKVLTSTRVFSYLCSFQAPNLFQENKLRQVLVDIVNKAVIANKPITIFIPYIFDHHPVHRASGLLFLKLLKEVMMQ